MSQRRESLLRVCCSLLCAFLLGCGGGKKDDGGEGGLSCLPTETNCGGVCADTLVSDDHCGGCGILCVVGDVCDQGACRPIGVACPEGRMLCEGTCVDVQSNSQNCGQCGTSCGAGSCQAGACSCAEGEATCGAACANISLDPLNCGGCGIACQPGQLCTAGSCQCEAGLSQCPGSCNDLTQDASNCGTCGTACSGGRECVAGGCVCPAGQSLCGDTCADLISDAFNCGTCGVACVGGQVCGGGSCACPEGQTLCGDTCVDLTTDFANCGACAAACVTGQACNSSVCACPDNEIVCDEMCVDAQISSDHCGTCGNACIGGQTCVAASCECPAGQELCDETCIDTRTDDANCGGCGVHCGLGESCVEGGCAGGALGEDGCEGMAGDVSLSKLSFYQTIEIPLMEEGVETENRNAEVVAGRNTLVRLFVEPSGGFQERQLSARLHLENGEERTVLSSGPQMISGASQDAQRGSTLEFSVEGELLTSETRYAVELVECGEGNGAVPLAPRFPAEDGIELGARTLGSLRVHIIPIRANGISPGVTEADLAIYREGFLASYPVSSVEFTLGEEVETSDDQDWSGMLDGLYYLRQADIADPEVYYYGMMRPTLDFGDYCQNGCIAGVGYVPIGFDGALDPSGRVALGLTYGDKDSVDTMLHEIGHNHGREHAPCVSPGSSIEGVDPNFPHDNAQLGVYGYDIRTDRLVEPERPDIMAYCEDPWFSDYTYNALIDAVIEVNQVQFSRWVDPSLVGAFSVLLVDPKRGARWGHPIVGPAMPVGQAESATVFGADGSIVAKIQVYRMAISEIDGFSIQVPEPQLGWHSVEIAGAGVVPF